VAVVNPGGQSSRLERGFTYANKVAAPTSVQISGNRVLTAVGQTSQFTATETFSDGSSRDVTAEGVWSVFPRRAANISPTGLLTAQRLGRFLISLERSGPIFFSGAEVTVTPPGTMAVFGYMFHPGSGEIVGAQVRNLQSGQVDDTPDGYFLMGNLTDLRMSATKELFEPVEFTATTDVAWFGPEPLNVGVPMQKILRVEVGGAQTADVLWPDDVEYQVTGNTFCRPCRLVRLFSQTSGTIRIRIMWTDSSTLNLWVNGQMFPPTGTREIVAEVPITSGHELIVYLGKIRGAVDNRVTFTFAASPGG
jgi:Bacterial Ig-like domain (group 2)